MGINFIVDTVRASISPAYRFQRDDGHETVPERLACKRLSDFASSTGPGGGSALVRAFRESAIAHGKPMVEGWINPHFHDPVMVRVTPEDTLWAFCDDPDQAEDVTLWHSAQMEGNDAMGYNAHEVEKILRSGFRSLLATPQNG